MNKKKMRKNLHRKYHKKKWTNLWFGEAFVISKLKANEKNNPNKKWKSIKKQQEIHVDDEREHNKEIPMIKIQGKAIWITFFSIDS